MKFASGHTKTVPLVCLVATLATSLSLLLTRDQRYVHRFPGLLQKHRNVVQVFVQVLASVLSLAQMLVITSLINFAARIKLFQSPVTMSNLSFWSALLISRFDRTLPPVKLGLVAVVLGLGTILGALWAGSLTPLSVTAFRPDGSVLVPCFNTTLEPALYPAVGSGAIIVHCHNNDTQDPRGSSYPFLDNCIVMDKLGNLIMTAATATNITNPKEHPKIDNSSWTYKGRSYGKGSLAGLYDVVNTTLESQDIGFSYEESGYNVQTTCEKQNYTMLSFQQEGANSELGVFNLWVARNVTMDSGNISIPPFYLVSPAYNEVNTKPFGYYAWSAFTQNGVHSLVTSSENRTWSESPEQLICTIEFVPWTFSVNISKLERSITVTPLDSIEVFNQTGNVADMIIVELDLMSRFSSSAMVYSSLYEAIYSNLLSARLAYAGLDDNTVWEYTLRDVVSEIADDLLTYHGILAISGKGNNSISQPVQRHFAAVQIGQQSYQIAQVVINVILCLACLFEIFRTQYWTQLPHFDFLDIDALLTAASGSERSDGHAPTRSPRASVKWHGNDHRTVMAIHDGQFGTRLLFSDGAGKERRNASRAGSSLHLLDNLRPWQSHQTVEQEPALANLPDPNLLAPDSRFQTI